MVASFIAAASVASFGDFRYIYIYIYIYIYNLAYWSTLERPPFEAMRGKTGFSDVTGGTGEGVGVSWVAPDLCATLVWARHTWSYGQSHADSSFELASTTKWVSCTVVGMCRHGRLHPKSVVFQSFLWLQVGRPHLRAHIYDVSKAQRVPSHKGHPRAHDMWCKGVGIGR